MGKTQSAGNRGEAAVARYLRQKGYTLLESQWRCRFGELDLVAKDKRGLLCIVEVKTRTNLSVGLPREYVTRQKQEKLRRTAACYLAARGLDCPVRFDVAEVYTDTAHSAAATRIEYLEDAF